MMCNQIYFVESASLVEEIDALEGLEVVRSVEGWFDRGISTF